MGVKSRTRPGNPVHSTPYYIIIHVTIFLAETAIMGLMGWILSPDTQGQLTGGDDATGNMPGYVFLMAFFSWFNSAAVIGLWLVDEYNPPLIRALIQLFILLPANAVTGFFLGWQNNWKVFLGTCNTGSILCKSVWKVLVRIEGVTVFLIGLVVVLTLVDALAAIRLWRVQKMALRRLVRMTSVRAKYQSSR